MLQIIRNLFRKNVTPAPQTYDQMVALGDYRHVDPTIKSRCSVNPQRFTIAGLEVVHFKKVMTTAQVETELELRGLRPAFIEELLAYGAKNLEEKGNFLIAALGTSINIRGARFVPCLDGPFRKLVVLPAFIEPAWESFSSFLAVRKTAPGTANA